MWKKNKEKPIKLGQIKNEKLEKFSDSITWNFDTTMLIFIRDGLKRFKQVNNGIPHSIFIKYELEEEAIAEWNEIIQTIIDNINYYLLDAEELLFPEQRSLLEEYHLGNHIKHIEELHDSSILVTYEEMPKAIKAIYAELTEITKILEEKLSKAFDLIKVWHANFSW